MADSCTLYCASNDLNEVECIALRLFPDASFRSSREDWSAIQLEDRGCTLQLTVKQYRHGGDDFSNLVLSTYFFVDNIQGINDDVKRHVLSCIERCELAIGVVATPSFGSNERFGDIVFEIATKVRGLIFNGYQVLDSEGRVLVERT
jgi:hypothetical protein